MVPSMRVWEPRGDDAVTAPGNRRGKADRSRAADGRPHAERVERGPPGDSCSAAVGEVEHVLSVFARSMRRIAYPGVDG
jgi:hypothetical protein